MSKSKETPSMAVVDFLTQVLGDGRGFLCIANFNRRTKRMRHDFFEYPSQIESAARTAMRHDANGRDAYFCVHLLSRKERKKLAAASITTLWADGDGALIPEGFPPPTLVVESSPGRHHYYWVLDGCIDATKAGRLEKVIQRAIGADPSGTDLSQLLRVPFTSNYKYDPPEAVVLQRVDGPIHQESDFDPFDEADPIPGSDSLKPAKGFRHEPPVSLTGADLDMWLGKGVLVAGAKLDRSKHLAKMANILRRNGADRDQIVESLGQLDRQPWLRKYVGRDDAEQRYTELADWSVENVVPKSQGLVVPNNRVTRGLPTTDLGNAERFATLYNDRVRHTPEGWKGWDGKRWAPDRALVEWLALENARTITKEASSYRGKAKLALARHARNSESASRIRATLLLAAAMPQLQAAVDDFDRRDLELNTESGILDLEAVTQRPHEPSAYHTKLAPVTIDADATCPRFDKFVMEIFPDPEVAAYVQRVAGYCLTGRMDEQCFFLLYGAGAKKGSARAIRIDRRCSFARDERQIMPPDRGTDHPAHPGQFNLQLPNFGHPRYIEPGLRWNPRLAAVQVA